MNAMGAWISGAAMSILGLLGLFMAARAGDSAIYFAGLALFVTSVLFVFVLIRLGTGAGRGPEGSGRTDAP